MNMLYKIGMIISCLLAGSSMMPADNNKGPSKNSPALVKPTPSKPKIAGVPSMLQPQPGNKPGSLLEHVGTVFRIRGKRSAHVQQLNQQLFDAVNSKNKATIQQLIDAGASVNAQDNTPLGGTPFMMALKDTSDIAELLLAAKADVDGTFSTGDTALHGVALGAGDCTAIEWLLEQGANINKKNKAGLTPLMCAVTHNNIDAIKVLLAHGANLHVKENNGITALDIATINKNREAIALLEQAAANAPTMTAQSQNNGDKKNNLVNDALQDFEHLHSSSSLSSLLTTSRSTPGLRPLARSNGSGDIAGLRSGTVPAMNNDDTADSDDIAEPSIERALPGLGNLLSNVFGAAAPTQQELLSLVAAAPDPDAEDDLADAEPPFICTPESCKKLSQTEKNDHLANAIKTGDRQAVRILIEAGADDAHKDTAGKSMVMLAKAAGVNDILNDAVKARNTLRAQERDRIKQENIRNAAQEKVAADRRKEEARLKAQQLQQQQIADKLDRSNKEKAEAEKAKKEREEAIARARQKKEDEYNRQLKAEKSRFEIYQMMVDEISDEIAQETLTQAHKKEQERQTELRAELDEQAEAVTNKALEKAQSMIFQDGEKARQERQQELHRMINHSPAQKTNNQQPNQSNLHRARQPKPRPTQEQWERQDALLRLLVQPHQDDYVDLDALLKQQEDALKRNKISITQYPVSPMTASTTRSNSSGSSTSLSASSTSTMTSPSSMVTQSPTTPHSNAVTPSCVPAVSYAASDQYQHPNRPSSQPMMHAQGASNISILDSGIRSPMPTMSHYNSLRYTGVPMQSPVQQYTVSPIPSLMPYPMMSSMPQPSPSPVPLVQQFMGPSSLPRPVPQYKHSNAQLVAQQTRVDDTEDETTEHENDDSEYVQGTPQQVQPNPMMMLSPNPEHAMYPAPSMPLQAPSTMPVMQQYQNTQPHTLSSAQSVDPVETREELQAKLRQIERTLPAHLTDCNSAINSILENAIKLRHEKNHTALSDSTRLKFIRDTTELWNNRETIKKQLGQMDEKPQDASKAQEANQNNKQPKEDPKKKIKEDFLLAVLRADMNLVKKVLGTYNNEQAAIDPEILNCTNKQGHSALMTIISNASDARIAENAAKAKENFEIAQYLVKRGINRNLVAIQGATAENLAQGIAARTGDTRYWKLVLGNECAPAILLFEQAQEEKLKALAELATLRKLTGYNPDAIG